MFSFECIRIFFLLSIQLSKMMGKQAVCEIQCSIQNGAASMTNTMTCSLSSSITLQPHHSWFPGSPYKHYAVWPPEGAVATAEACVYWASRLPCLHLKEDLLMCSARVKEDFNSSFRITAFALCFFWGRLLIHNRIVVEL